MKTPKRIQRRRVKGWRMPDNAVCVSRPSRWGNPFVMGRRVRLSLGVYVTARTLEESLMYFRAWATR